MTPYLRNNWSSSTTHVLIKLTAYWVYILPSISIRTAHTWC